ncbi:MAG: 1-acyl-sn-glycerol-3-phosphate acyltransferase [Clostridiales bacterium]|nr:1-acyl-sn-glycerol-3-phosphate acyltransferase [Clostridiales bacterium]
MKKTIEQKLMSHVTKRPNKLIYNLLGGVVKAFSAKKLGVNYIYKIDIKKIKGPFILISNHASRSDYVYTGFAFLPHTINFVVGHNEFYRSHLKGIFGIMNAIPKRNFVADFYTVKEMVRILKSGGNICFMPEGMSSISGENQPIANGSAKFIKHSKVPVYYTKISGGYLTETKYCLDQRPGKVDVIIDQMFTVEDLERLSVDEINDIIEEKIYNDDYAYNAQKQYVYKSRGEIAKDLETLLFICPTCGKRHTLKSDKNRLYCTNCGAGVDIDDTYKFTPITDTTVYPESPSKWYRWQRQVIKNELIKNPDFVMTQKIKLGVLPKYKYLKKDQTSLIVGEGELKLDGKGLSFNGVRDEKPFEFFIPIEMLPTYGMCTDVTRFYTFATGEFLEFYPETNKVAEWFITTEEMHRVKGGKWQDFKWADKPIELINKQ